MPELPLFPLNTVLFPGMPLNLHIFEDRYKEMMKRCIGNNEPFGVVLIKQGTEAFGPTAEPYAVGCTAHIKQVQPLTQGRMNISSVGQDRFKIKSLDRAETYLVGEIEYYPLENYEPQKLVGEGQYLRPWIERYLTMLARAGDVQFDASELPEDPLALAYLGAVLLQVPLDQKQNLLELKRTADLMKAIRVIFRREVALLEFILSKTNTETDSPFSVN